jgi:hypothetical protein
LVLAFAKNDWAAVTQATINTAAWLRFALCKRRNATFYSGWPEKAFMVSTSRTEGVSLIFLKHATEAAEVSHIHSTIGTLLSAYLCLSQLPGDQVALWWWWR